jgi:hypothetical protein
VCGQLGVQARLPACLSLGKTERETSWHSLLMHLRRRASTPDADDVFRSDVDQVAASWAAIRRRFRGRGIRQPRQLVLDPRAQPAVWLIPEVMTRQPHWLEALRRVLHRVDTAAIFPRLDRGGGAPIPAHQTLLREVIAGLKDPQVPTSRLFEIELWNQVRSTAPLCCWIATVQRHGIISTLQSDDICLKSTGPILDLLALGSCPETPRQLLLELVLWLAPSMRTVPNKDGGAERGQRGQGPSHVVASSTDKRQCGVPIPGRHCRRGPIRAIQHLHQGRGRARYGGRHTYGNHLPGEVEPSLLRI